jgi:hypothetical protein
LRLIAFFCASDIVLAFAFGTDADFAALALLAAQYSFIRRLCARLEFGGVFLGKEQLLMPHSPAFWSFPLSTPREPPQFLRQLSLSVFQALQLPIPIVVFDPYALPVHVNGLQDPG